MPTRHGRPVILTFVLTVCLLCGGALTAQRSLRERHLTVTVLDSNDVPVDGLGIGDFVVREDGTARELLRVDPAPAPSHVMLLIDTSDATEDIVADLRRSIGGVVRQFAEFSGPLSLGLTTTGERPTAVVPLTTRVGAIDEAVAKLTPRRGSGAYFMDGVIEAADRLRREQGPRPVIVAFVDESGPEFSTADHRQVEDALHRSHVALWTVVLQSNQSVGSLETRERAIVTGDVSRASGGATKAVLSKEGLARAFEQVVTALTSGYDVVYGRPDTLIPASTVTVTSRAPKSRALAVKWAD